MVLIANRRSVMTLYSNPTDLYSHRVRVVLAEKGTTAEVVPVTPTQRPQELLELNPYGTVPVLVDRELVLYQSQIIMEYLDERYPHPPLLPVFPVARAQARLMLHRIDRDWYRLAQHIEQKTGAEQEAARRELAESLLGVAPLFANHPFFLSDELTLVDCALMPLLWRLNKLKVPLGNTPKSRTILQYAQRLFARDAFQASLTDPEREMHV